MKKKLTAIMLIIAMAVQAVVLAADDTIKVIFKGEQINFDVPPVIENDRTLVPMRAIFEKLGYDVEWDGETRSIRATNKTDEINMHIDFYTFWRNGEAMQMDVAPTIRDGRTLVPLRAVSEASGCDVQWNDVTKTIYIGKGDVKQESVMKTPEPTVEPTQVPVISDDIYLDKTELKIDEGKSEVLNATVKAWMTDGRIVWNSSDHTIATVTAKGKVTALKEGECIITATIKGQTAECKVTVRNVPKEPELESIGYNTTKLFVDNRHYVTITLFNYGDYPVTIPGEAEYTYLTAPETGKTSTQYDIYTQKLSSPQVIIKPGSYEQITFTMTKDKPEVGKKANKKDFEETLKFKFEYDGKTYTATKIKTSSRKDEEQKIDFKYN